MLYHNSLLIHRLTFLKTVVNPFFLIGAVTQMDSRSSTSKCEVFAQRYDVSMKMCVIVLEFANRIMHRCFHFHRSCYHFRRTWYRFHRRWSSDVWKIRRRQSCKRRFLKGAYNICSLTWSSVCILFVTRRGGIWRYQGGWRWMKPF